LKRREKKLKQKNEQITNFLKMIEFYHTTILPCLDIFGVGRILGSKNLNLKKGYCSIPTARAW